MHVYRELRVKWSFFHRLLRLTDERLRYGTPGLSVLLRRRRELLLGFSDLLKERGEYHSLVQRGGSCVFSFYEDAHVSPLQNKVLVIDPMRMTRNRSCVIDLAGRRTNRL